VAALSLIADRPRTIALTSGKGPNFSQVTAAIESQTTTLSSFLSTLDGNTDELEAFVDQLEGFVDGLEALVGTTNTTLSAIDTAQDLTNTNLTGIDSKLASILTDTTAIRLTNIDIVSQTVGLSTQVTLLAIAATLVANGLVQIAISLNIADIEVLMESVELQLQQKIPVLSAGNMFYQELILTDVITTIDSGTAPSETIYQLESISMVNTSVSNKIVIIRAVRDPTGSPKFIKLGAPFLPLSSDLGNVGQGGNLIAIMKKMWIDENVSLDFTVGSLAVGETIVINLLWSRVHGSVA